MIDPGTVSALLVLAAIHWVADFYLQTDSMAVGKSSSNWDLTRHVLTYTAVLFACTGAPHFALVNGACHWVTDYGTSRLNARLWKAERRHDFFVSVGFDQLIHLVTLGVTLVWFYS